MLLHLMCFFIYEEKKKGKGRKNLFQGALER